jgi:hypothetical protein
MSRFTRDFPIKANKIYSLAPIQVKMKAEEIFNQEMPGHEMLSYQVYESESVVKVTFSYI